MGCKAGYIRVSSIDQNTARQLADLELDNTFVDKCSGGNADRPELKRCLEWVREGDTLHVHSIDRLARDLFDLQSLLNQLVDKGVTVVFQKENLIFSGEKDPMKNLMLQMMGAFAEFERSLIKERQREGIAAAKAKSKRWGRKPSLDAAQIEEANTLLIEGRSKAEVARRFCVSRPTLNRHISTNSI